MPELPEVETVVRGLRVLKGKKIVSVDVRRPKLVSVGPKTLSPKRQHTLALVRAFERAIIGKKILRVMRRAKLIQLQLSNDWWLFIHLKMAGQMVIQRKGQKRLLIRLLNSAHAPLEAMPSKHTHITVRFSDGTLLYYNDARLFGTWRAVQDVDLPRVVDLAGYGPEPLERGFTAAGLRSALQRRPRMPIKQALTDQTLLAGVGNIYADEILFSARLKPTRNVESLKPADWQLLFRSLQRVLRHAIRTHGSSVGEFIRTDGSVGTYGRYHKVYGRKNRACVRCGTPIIRITLGGRGTHYCPVCQH